MAYEDIRVVETYFKKHSPDRATQLTIEFLSEYPARVHQAIEAKEPLQSTTFKCTEANEVYAFARRKLDRIGKYCLMQKLDDAANQINKRLKQKLTLAQLALENPQTYRMIVETEEQISEFNKLYCAKVALINTLNISPDMKKLQKRRLKDRKKKILTVIRKDLSESMGQAADEEIQAGSLESEILDYENDQTAEQ